MNAGLLGTLSKLNDIPGLLRNAGLKVPQPITNAVKDAKRKPVFTLVDKAKVKIESAKTDEEWQAGVMDLATAYTVEAAGKTEQFNAVLDSYRQRAIFSAVKEVASGPFEELADKYNAAVPEFSQAIRRIPDRVDEIKAVDLPPDVPVAIAEARKASEVLVPVWDAYRPLASLLGYWQGGNSAWYDQTDTVFLLSIPNSDADASAAAMELHRMANNGQYGNLRPFQPHATLSVLGELSLCRNPAEAQTRRDKVGTMAIQPVLAT